MKITGYIDIFIFHVPIFGDAPELAFDDGIFKLWSIIAQPIRKIPYATFMRETVRNDAGESISLQQRVNDCFRDDYPTVGLQSLAAPFYVRPATELEVIAWLGGHYKRVLK